MAMRFMTAFMVLALAPSFLAGCHQQSDTSKLTCKDDPTGRSDAEKRAIADACFLDGANTPSSKKKW